MRLQTASPITEFFRQYFILFIYPKFKSKIYTFPSSLNLKPLRLVKKAIKKYYIFMAKSVFPNGYH